RRRPAGGRNRGAGRTPGAPGGCDRWTWRALYTPCIRRVYTPSVQSFPEGVADLVGAGCHGSVTAAAAPPAGGAAAVTRGVRGGWRARSVRRRSRLLRTRPPAPGRTAPARDRPDLARQPARLRQRPPQEELDLGVGRTELVVRPPRQRLVHQRIQPQQHLLALLRPAPRGRSPGGVRRGGHW